MTKLLNVTLALAGALVLAGAAAAQEQAPEAGRLFDGLKDQLTIVLPEGWTVYDQTAAVTGKPSPYGLVYFSAESILAPGEKVVTPDNPEAFFRVRRGDIPSFFVDRHRAGKGMSCSRLTRDARSEIELMVGNDSVFGGQARQELQPNKPRTSEIELAGCQGLKLEGSGKGWRLDVRAVSDGKTLYLFSLRNTADNFAKNFGAYETALATLRLSSGPAGASGVTAAPAHASPSAKGSFDGRAWRQGYTGRNRQMEVTEYVLPGEVVEAWTELVTVQRMFGAGGHVRPLELMTGAKKETLKECPSTVWTVLRQERDEILYQWEQRGCRGLGDELEVAKVYRDGSDLVRVAWDTRKLPVTEETRAAWIKIMSDYR